MSIIIRIFVVIIGLPILGILALCGHVRSRRVLQAANAIVVFRAAVWYEKRSKPESYFSFQGIDCTVNPQVLATFGVPVIDGVLSALIISLGFGRTVIVTSKVPDFSCPADLAVMWHEIGHAVNGDLPRFRKHYIQTGQSGVVFADAEIAADAYAAAKVSAEAMVGALVALAVDIPAGECRDLVEDRISILEHRQEEG